MQTVWRSRLFFENSQRDDALGLGSADLLVSSKHGGDGSPAAFGLWPEAGGNMQFCRRQGR